MKKSLLVTVCAVFAAAMVFAGGGSEKKGTSGGVEVTIPHYKSGQNIGGVFFLPQVERFNAKYAGKYKVIVEELVQDMYSTKMQQLSLQGKLPVLIEGGATEWLEEFIIPQNLFADLKPLIDSNAELKARLIPESIEYNTINGKVFSITYPKLSPIGVYYNSNLYKPSKSLSLMTWDQLLAEFGNNKIAFMTSENAWTTMLVLSSLIAVQPGGARLLQDHAFDKQLDITNPIIVKAFSQLQPILQKYASSNTLGAAYADAANSFMSQQSALIANGSWMIGDFAADQSSKWSNNFSGNNVHADVYPGNVAIGGPGISYGWWVPSTATPAEQELGRAFIEFIMSQDELERHMLAEGGTTPRMNPSAAFLAERAKNRLLDEYSGAVKSNTILSYSFQDAVPSSIGGDSGELGKMLPLLISGSLTAEQFCKELSIKAKETAR